MKVKSNERLMRFDVMRIHSDYLPKYALVLLGWNGQYYITPRYVRIGTNEYEFKERVEELNEQLRLRDKLLPKST